MADDAAFGDAVLQDYAFVHEHLQELGVPGKLADVDVRFARAREKEPLYRIIVAILYPIAGLTDVVLQVELYRLQARWAYEDVVVVYRGSERVVPLQRCPY